jgi:hypothetical protein
MKVMGILKVKIFQQKDKKNVKSEMKFLLK